MLPLDHLRSLSQMRQPALVTLSRKTFDLRRTLNVRKTPDTRKTLLPLDGSSSSIIYGLARASGPALDAEEVTILLSTNAKG